MPATTQPPATREAHTEQARRAWVAPRVECFETRPEVTAYAGDSGPWLTR